MSFLDLDIHDEYRSLKDNIGRDFYTPLLNEAAMYKRAVGFFSSSALTEMAKGITGLIENNGKIQLIASPRLSAEDIEAIHKGYELREQIIERALLASLTVPKNYYEERRLNLLANLIADGRLDIKIAFTESHRVLGMYHEKMGLFYDKEGNVVAFAGSMNESSTAMTLNYESIDVFCSWTKDKDRVESKINTFSSIWNNCEPNVQIIDFPRVSKEILEKYKRGPIDLTIDKNEFSSDCDTTSFVYKQGPDTTSKVYEKIEGPVISSSMNLYDYQMEAINEWEKRNFCGIFDMATGTGKTFTGLGAVSRLFERCNKKLAVIIVCPYQHLVEQWIEDIVLFNMKPIIGYSASSQKSF